MGEPKESARDEYTSVKLPKAIGVMVDELISIKQLGFKTRTEVVKEAIRQLYEKTKSGLKKT